MSTDIFSSNTLSAGTITTTTSANAFSINAAPTYTITTTPGTGIIGANANSLTDLSSSLKVTGNLILNGLDVDERLRSIEKLLQMPDRDAKMEEKYKELRKLADQYNELLEKLRVWDALKS